MQVVRDWSGVLLAAAETSYADGSEDRILEVLLNATDRSSGSDELARHINDWPSRYHFSRLRANLFTPFRFTPEHRVLEIGCGTGCNVRAIAETGALVVGVEGSLNRARSARVRCAELENVEIYAGDFNEIEDLGLFDVVLLIGVLEYSASEIGGSQGPFALLKNAASKLKPNGQLVLAIENQLGLKYLLGYPEDHLAEPWVGVDGYLRPKGVRTWSRAELSQLLSSAGFVDQSWYYPFPDYKLPHFIASDRFFESERLRSFVPQLARPVVRDYSGLPVRLSDPMLVFREFVSAGLGADISNSFLVVASEVPIADMDIREPGIGWMQSGERLSRWRSFSRLFENETGGLRIRNVSEGDSPEVVEGWLGNQRVAERDLVVGVTLEDELVRAAPADLREFGRLIELFSGYLRRHATPTHGRNADHPFAPIVGEDSLPPHFLDCSPKNLVIDESGALEFIDPEWGCSSGVSLQLVYVRGLWELAMRLVLSGIRHQWRETSSVEDLVRHFADFGSIELGSGVIDRLLVADASLLKKVTGIDHERSKQDERQLSVAHQQEATTRVALDFRVRRVHADLQRVLETQSELNRQLQEASSKMDAMHLELQLNRAELQQSQTESQSKDRELSDLVSRLEREMTRAFLAESKNLELRKVQRELAEIRGSMSLRVGRVMTAPLRVLRRFRKR